MTTAVSILLAVVVILALSVIYSSLRLSWLRNRADKCSHEWELYTGHAPELQGATQCRRCRLMKGQRGT